jgi:hypothetical protein
MSGLFRAVKKVVGDVLGSSSKPKPVAPPPPPPPPTPVISSAESIEDNSSKGNLNTSNIDPRKKTRLRRRQSVLSLDNTNNANDRILGN